MLDVPLACPRCTQPMAARIAEPRPGAKTIRADVCSGCGGIWLDEYELAEVSPQLGSLSFRKEEVERTGAPAAGIATCPRCAATPVQITLLDVAVDVCPGCRGVWLDGGEYEALARAAAMDAAEKAESTATYRLAPRAAKAARRGIFDCPRCGGEKPTAEGMITPGGLVCGPCFHQHVEADLLAEASRHHGPITDRMKAGAFSPRGDATHEGPWGRGGGPLLAVLGVLAATGPAYCQHCGRARRDPLCGHF